VWSAFGRVAAGGEPPGGNWGHRFGAIDAATLCGIAPAQVGCAAVRLRAGCIHRDRCGCGAAWRGAARAKRRRTAGAQRRWSPWSIWRWTARPQRRRTSWSKRRRPSGSKRWWSPWTNRRRSTWAERRRTCARCGISASGARIYRRRHGLFQRNAGAGFFRQRIFGQRIGRIGRRGLAWRITRRPGIRRGNLAATAAGGDRPGDIRCLRLHIDTPGHRIGRSRPASLGAPPDGSARSSRGPGAG
jgi:hypothetical protein